MWTVEPNAGINAQCNANATVITIQSLLKLVENEPEPPLGVLSQFRFLNVQWKRRSDVIQFSWFVITAFIPPLHQLHTEGWMPGLVRNVTLNNNNLNNSFIYMLPFSFLRREMNFFGGMTPTFFFCVVMLLKRSARQVSRLSLRRGCTL